MENLEVLDDCTYYVVKVRDNEVTKKGNLFTVFSSLMAEYEEKNESTIYDVGLFLFRVTHFIMTAFLVITVIQ
jgi:hypothetical protein